MVRKTPPSSFEDPLAQSPDQSPVKAPDTNTGDGLDKEKDPPATPASSKKKKTPPPGFRDPLADPPPDQDPAKTPDTGTGDGSGKENDPSVSSVPPKKKKTPPPLFVDPLAPGNPDAATASPDAAGRGGTRTDRRDADAVDAGAGDDDELSAADLEKMGAAKRERLLRQQTVEKENTEREIRVREKVRPAVSKAKAKAIEAGSREVFSCESENEPGRAVVVIKDSTGEYIDFGQALGEEDVRLVFGSKVAANMEAKEVTIPRNLTRRDLPFLAREVLRVVYLGRQKMIEGEEKKPGKNQKGFQHFFDYTESDESVLLNDEVEAREKYKKKLEEIRRDFKLRPQNSLRKEYQEAETDYLKAMKKSEGLLDTLVMAAASHFSANAGFELFSGWNGWEGFKTEKNRRLEDRQSQFVFPYDKDGKGFLTGYYTQENPEARTLNRLDLVPVLAAFRRGTLDKGSLLDRLFVDPVRRGKRVLWDGSETVQNANFRQAIELGCENDDDRKGLEAWWGKNKSWAMQHLPLEMAETLGKDALGLLMVLGYLPIKLGEVLLNKVDDVADSVFNVFLKGSGLGWKNLASKESPSAVAKKKRDEIKSRVKSLLNRTK